MIDTPAKSCSVEDHSVACVPQIANVTYLRSTIGQQPVSNILLDNIRLCGQQ